MFVKHRRLCFTLALALVSLSLFAQIPDKYENLEVLPKDISKKDMINIMKSYSRSLGVRCNFCHKGEAGAPLSSYDFASDEPEHKIITRTMMKMVNEMNGKYLKDIEGPGKSFEVNCRTCHRGIVHPLPLEEVLEKTMDQKGLDQAIERYRKLREEYYGSDAYNFGEDTLLNLGESLSAASKDKEAQAMLELNLEFFPKSAFTYFTLGEVYAGKGDKEKAIANMEKAISIMPNHKGMIERLEEVKAEQK